MTATLKIGGPFARPCDTCRQPPGAGCVTTDRGGRNTSLPRKRPHAARVKAAPPEAEVKVGDLVILDGVDGEALALVEELGEPVALRRWWGRQFGALVRLWPSNVLRLAPEDDRTAAASAALAQHPR